MVNPIPKQTHENQPVFQTLAKAHVHEISLFGSAVECHFELLNFACSVNGVFCTTQVAKWTHDIFHVAPCDLVRFSAGFPTHFETGRM
jgi:hypothetical protein